MKLQNKIFYDFVKRFYEKVSEIDNKEEVYCKGTKVVVIVKDEEIGVDLYDVIKTLKDRKEVISTHKMTFKISKYFIDKYNRVQIFCIDFEKKENDFSKLGKLLEFVELVDDMKDKGFILDNTKFENEKCNCISSFLSFFVVAREDVLIFQEYIIEYIHYVLSNGGNLEEFYTKILKQNVFCRVSEFPYNLPIITMCYNYFVLGTVPENINDILIREIIEEEYGSAYFDYLIAINKNIDSDLQIIEDNEDYTIYDGNVKIYHNISSEFERFLKNINIEENMEYIETKIIDFNGKVIGYKFSMHELQSTHTILDKKFENQNEIFDFISKMSTYLLRINCLDCRFNKEINDFDIKKSLIYIGDFSIDFKIIGIKDLFYLISMDENILKKQITTIFFELYLIYLKHLYGEIYNEEKFLEKVEVRYLSPILAREFINYALKKEVCYKIAIEEYFKFIHDAKVTVEGYSYDSRFEYNPLDTPFIFDYEAERRYGIKIKNNMYKRISDGRELITFKKKRKISKLKKQDDSLRKELLEKLGHIEDEHIKLVRISELIYSKDINNENMYKLVGYVTEPIKGKLLTDEVLLSLNNKDFLKVAGYLFSKFNYYYIPLNTIWMDDNFVFYINVLDKNFKIFKNSNNDFIDLDKNLNINTKSKNNSFINWIIAYLINEKGYNPNYFIDWDFDDIYHSTSNQVLLELANSYDTYCDEHGIYYNSKKKLCPVCLKTKYFISQDFEETSSKLFEDMYAKHYKMDEQYHLKVYKTSCVDLAKIERNIDKIITEKLHSDELDLGQDCFVPYKKAIDHNKQFIGYIYENTSFNDESIDLKDSNLRNLPRIMSLIRLILQIKDLTQNKLCFIKNPFGHVYLNKNHKKQVQILNVEFLSKNGSIENTLRWTYDYVCDVITSDDFIELDISNCSMDLDDLLTNLQDLSKDLTKYCSIHKMYYKKQNIFCPKCIDKAQLKNIEVEYVDPSTITKQKDLTQGGESIIYPYGDNLVAKVFKEKKINYDFKNLVISKLFSRKEILEGINNKKLKYKYVVPQKLLIDNESQNTFGYIMEKVNGNPISILKDKVEVEKLEITMKDVFEILIAVGEGIKTLHTNNIYIGDLNGRNILFDSEKNVYFLDFDGMGIDDIDPMFFTDEYIDPLSVKNQSISMKDDWYSFAVQAFYYLTLTHPFNGIYYSIEEDGKKVRLDEIPDKMERRISLLGNHGMEAPAIALSWDWMSKELKAEFLNIFEGNSRKSIVPYLVSQYETIYKDDPYNPSKTNIRINSKFIATQINPFSGNVVHVINHYSAVCKKVDTYYVAILVNEEKQYDINLPQCMEINEILLSENKKIAFAIFEKEIIVVDLEANAQIYNEEISDAKNVVVNENTLYFTGIFEEKNIIFQRDFSIKEEVKKEKINFLPKQETKRFLAKFNSKFILVKRAKNNDEIYCNSEKFCHIDYDSEEPMYNIAYDDVTRSWLIVNSQKEGIIIKADGNYKTFNISKDINDINIETVIFNKGKIYIPNQDYLYIINTNDQITIKKMECHKIMTPNSQLFDINTKGFSVITDDILYEIRRG